MSKFAFVILHYNTIEDTRCCVDSIRKNVNGAEYHIVIIDNCSPNQSGHILKDEYENDKDVMIIFNKENLGFARGNNVGFKIAKEQIQADYIILLNSDTILLERKFVHLVIQEFGRSRFAVLGPMIINGSGFEARTHVITINECIKSIFVLSCYYLLSFIRLDVFFRKVINIFIKPQKRICNYERKENVQLHGCFLIFSKEYFSRFDGLNNKTFMYREEELLFLRIQRNALKSVYLPSIKIFHKGEGSTSSLYKSNLKKRRFAYKERTKSTVILLLELLNK